MTTFAKGPPFPDMPPRKTQDLWVTIKLGAMDVMDPDKKAPTNGPVLTRMGIFILKFMVVAHNFPTWGVKRHPVTQCY